MEIAMRVPSVLLVLVALSALVAPREGRAECAGFTDVDVGGFLTGFCPSVTWIKNRAITVGCTSATLYCPNESVARLSMAAFMNRLGNVFSPYVQSVEDAGGALDLSNPTGPQSLKCQTTAPVPVTTYRRRTLVDAVVSFDADAPVLFGMSIASSNNGGAFGNINETGIAVDGDANARRSISTSWISVAVPGQPDQHYAVRLFRLSGAGNLTNWTCSLQVTLINDNQP
jgi:hypothetical protein